MYTIIKDKGMEKIKMYHHSGMIFVLLLLFYGCDSNSIKNMDSTPSEKETIQSCKYDPALDGFYDKAYKPCTK
jgi:hypothetical protein